MTLTADALPDSAPLGRDLLTQVRRERCAADASERAIMALAVEYAYANPALPGQEEWQPARLPVWHDSSSLEDVEPEDCDWYRLPAMRWDAPAAFAAANGMSTISGKAVIRDALVLRHRAPGTWQAMHAGFLTVRLSRKVAEQLVGQHDDVCRYVDDAIVERIAEGQHVGPAVIEQLLDEAMLRLHAEQRELEQLEALDQCHVTIDPATINHSGIVEIDGAADWADAAPFDEKLTEIAEAIKDHPDFPEAANASLAQRRSIALRVIADPAWAQAILDGRTDPGGTAPTRTRELPGVLNLTDGNLLGIDPVITTSDLKATLTQVISQWVGRPDIDLKVQVRWHCGGKDGGCTDCPAHIDCTNHPERMAITYAPGVRDREIVETANPTCVHPYCPRKARRCDCDHVIPWDPDDPGGGGVTCPKCNLAPLCRHHHRLKTLTGWRYWKLDLQTYLWQDPHGLMYLRTRDGTRPLD